MLTCPNCGAQIDNDVSKCPYCGYINIEGANKQFKKDIEDIKDDIKEVKKEPARAFKKGMVKGSKVLVRTIIALCVIAAIYMALLLYATKNSPKLFKSAEDEANEAAYRLVVSEQLNDAYENHDIEELARIYDKAYSEDRMNIFGLDHYDTAYAASCYIKLRECLPNLDKEKISKKEAEEITYYCFYFYYRAYGEDGAVLFDSIRENEIIPVVHDRLGFSDADMESFRGDVTNSYGVVRRYVHKVVKKYYKNYH